MRPASGVRHWVLFKFAAGVTDAQIEAVTARFRALTATIPGIIGFEHGVNNSPEGLSRGFTHAYLLTFESEAARDAYLPHPEHQTFSDSVVGAGLVEEVFVFDYVPRG